MKRILSVLCIVVIISLMGCSSTNKEIEGLKKDNELLKQMLEQIMDNTSQPASAETPKKEFSQDKQTSTANNIEKENKSRKIDVMEVISKSKEVVQKEDGKAYIEITADSEPVYWVIDNNTGNEHWFYQLTFKETNGVGLNVEEIRETYYTDREGGHYKKLDKNMISNFWENSYIEANSFRTFIGGGNRCATKYMVWSIKGTDDNGNHVEYKYCMTMSQEPLSAHQDSVFKDVYEAKKKPNLIKGQTYVDISADQNPVYFNSITNSFYYSILFEETNGIGMHINELQIIPYAYSGRGHFKIFKNKDLEKILGSTYLAPNSFLGFSGGSSNDHSARDLRHFLFVIHGIDDNNNEVEFKYCLDLTTELISEKVVIDKNQQYDTHNLRYDSDFEKKVADGVYWVPVNKLGKSRYSNKDIAGMVSDTPELKQSKIGTLYEAIQLFQISNFSSADDNKRISEGEINWEHHKPGYDAVRTNEGCCATNSNWLNYILKEDYQEIGFVAFSQSDGSGHIFNYIKDNGYYYFIDLTHYRLDFQDGTSPETGNLNDYISSDRIAGNLHKAERIEDYISYYRSMSNDPAEMFFIYTADDCLPIDGVRKDGKIYITYPNNVEVNVVFDIHDDNLLNQFVAPPKEQYNWSIIPSHDFRAVLPD
jgi:hypothetical protein